MNTAELRISHLVGAAYKGNTAAMAKKLGVPQSIIKRASRGHRLTKPEIDTVVEQIRLTKVADPNWVKYGTGDWKYKKPDAPDTCIRVRQTLLRCWFGNLDNMSKDTGIPKDRLSDIINKSEPTEAELESIINVASVDTDWLVHGTGKPDIGGPPTMAAIDSIIQKIKLADEYRHQVEHLEAQINSMEGMINKLETELERAKRIGAKHEAEISSMSTRIKLLEESGEYSTP